jgi:hypothetical protein
MAQKLTALTDDHYECMDIIDNGATVFEYASAVRLREVQALHPEAITIIPTHELPKFIDVTDGTGRRAYFAARLTARGREMVDEWNNSL